MDIVSGCGYVLSSARASLTICDLWQYESEQRTALCPVLSRGWTDLTSLSTGIDNSASLRYVPSLLFSPSQSSVCRPSSISCHDQLGNSFSFCLPKAYTLCTLYLLALVAEHSTPVLYSIIESYFFLVWLNASCGHRHTVLLLFTT